MASNESYGTRLFRFWVPSWWSLLWLVIGLAPLFFFQTFIHEGLHYVTSAAGGSDPTLIPFAHFNTRFGTSGQNLNGAVLDTAGFAAMPQIVAFVLLIVMSILLIVLAPSWRGLRLFMTWWYLGLILDLFYNTGAGLFAATAPGRDWGKFTTESGAALTVTLAWLIWLVGLSHFAWIAFTRWHNNRPAPAGFFDFRGIAILFGSLSLIVLLWSQIERHPAIVHNGWFWGNWIWQLIVFLICVGYVIWASVRRA